MSISSFFGQCQCGAVQFSFHGEVEELQHCHCNQCRRAHSASFVSRVIVDNFDFSWETGADQLGYYQSSESATRTYCKQCATKMVILYNDKPGKIAVPVGSIQGELNPAKQYHVFVKNKATWFKIEDNLPKFEAWPEVVEEKVFEVV